MVDSIVSKESLREALLKDGEVAEKIIDLYLDSYIEDAEEYEDVDWTLMPTHERIEDFKLYVISI
jgi:hypothetical protein